MVSMDQQDYINKANALLQDTNTYKVLNKDPTNSLKNKLITLLNDIKQEASITPHTNNYIPPMQSPQILWPSQNSQSWHPLKTIVYSRGSIIYGVATELAYIIKPLVGQSPHHLKNTQHFIQQLQGKRLEPGEVITSFDVKALFTSVPTAPSIQIVKQKLQQDPTLPQSTSMSIQQITTLL